MTRVEDLRKEVGDLIERRRREELTDDRFRRFFDRGMTDLFRAMASEAVVEQELILAEHHTVLAHTKLAGSILKESDQEMVSLFATDHRLIRFRMLWSGFPAEPDDFLTRITIDELSSHQMSDLKTHRQIRKGEILVGLAVFAGALAFRPVLQLTGISLAILGALGAIHGLLVPMRWIEVMTVGQPRPEPFIIVAVRKKTARKLIRVIRAQINRAHD